MLLKNLFSMPLRLFRHISFFCLLQEAEVDKNAAICSGVRFYRGKLGRYSYIGPGSFVTDAEIGAFTSISSDCYIGGTAHPMDWVSSSSVFHKWENILKTNFARHEFDIFHKTMIGNDVWIGNRAMIKAGVVIGDGAVIGMGSVVTKDVGPYEIWAGNPARLIRKRFPDEQIKAISESKWWEWPEEKLYEYGRWITDPELFLEKLK